MPRFQGPQIQRPPANFIIQENSYAERRMFPERDVAFHTTWVHTDVSGVSVLYIDGHAGSTTLEDVIAARERAVSAATDPDAIFGEIEVVEADGRKGWGWSQRVQSPSRGLVQVAYSAVIPYDTATWVLEFISGEPTLKSAAPDTLRTIISSFAIGRTRWNLPLIGLGFVGLFALAGFQRSRAKARADRLRSINLVTIKKEKPKDGEGESDDEGGVGGVGAA